MTSILSKKRPLIENTVSTLTIERIERDEFEARHDAAARLAKMQRKTTRLQSMERLDNSVARFIARNADLLSYLKSDIFLACISEQSQKNKFCNWLCSLFEISEGEPFYIGEFLFAMRYFSPTHAVRDALVGVQIAIYSREAKLAAATTTDDWGEAEEHEVREDIEKAIERVFSEMSRAPCLAKHTMVKPRLALTRVDGTVLELEPYVAATAESLAEFLKCGEEYVETNIAISHQAAQKIVDLAASKFSTALEYTRNSDYYTAFVCRGPLKQVAKKAKK